MRAQASTVGIIAFNGNIRSLSPHGVSMILIFIYFTIIKRYRIFIHHIKLIHDII